MLRLYFLGPPRVESEGSPLEVDTRKATAILAYLALSREAQSRDTLAALLWPESDQSRARAALRRTLSALKKALAGPWLTVTRESIGLDPGAHYWADVDRFQELLASTGRHDHPRDEVCRACLPVLEEAAGCYRGDFLQGFTLRDSPGFDDWQAYHTERLRRDLGQVLEKLVQGYGYQGDYDLAIGHARRWLELDSLREAAHRSLMSLYAWSGQRTAALRQYRACVRILDQELGVPPLDETTALYEAIKEGELAHPSRPAAAGAQPELLFQETVEPALAAERSAVPLIGRSLEWSGLQAAYRRVSAAGQLVVIEGEAGIGKTRLAEELVEHVRAGGGGAISALCYEGESNLAYGPFAQGLRSALQAEGARDKVHQLPGHWLGEAARLLPELLEMRASLESPPAQDGPGAQVRFYEALSQVVRALLAGQPPGILFLDDVHFADEASLELLAYLVRRLPMLPVCLLVTWRSEEMPGDHPLRLALGEAVRAGTGQSLVVPRWSRDDLNQLVGALELDVFTPELVDRLHAETEGLPYFVLEYLAALPSDLEGWTEADWRPPASVREVLLSHLTRVSQTGSQLLTTAAAIGRSFDFETLRAASGRSAEEVVAGLEDLLRAGLIQEIQALETGESPVYDFRHEQLRRVVYGQTSLARRRLLHRRAAEALLARPGRRATGALAAQVAQHFHQAGLESQAAEYFVLAGEQARQLYANREALSHFRSALALEHPDSLALHEAVGDLETLVGDYPAALNSYENAAALAEPATLGRLEHRLGGVYHRLGAWDLAEAHYEAALEAYRAQEQQAELLARLHADWSLTAHQQGLEARSVELADRALHLAKETAEDAEKSSSLAQAHNILGILARSAGDLERARHHLERSLSLAEELGDPGGRVAALNNLALVQQSGEEFEPALDTLQAALRLCVSQGDRHREAALHNNLADLLHAMGRSDEALDHLKQAVVIFSEIGVQAGDWQPEIWKLMEW